MQVARWVEEMRAEPMTTEVLAAPFGQRRDRNARRVRADDRCGTPRSIDLLEQRALDVELFDDGFDDPVAVLDARQLVKAARRNQPPRIGGEEWIRLQRSRAF